jgi:hypothetical protein
MALASDCSTDPGDVSSFTSIGICATDGSFVFARQGEFSMESIQCLVQIWHVV